MDLTPDQPYVVLGIEADDFRILNDQGRPYLYPRDLFTIVDPREPEDWMSERGEDNERYAYPPPLNSSGFFDRFWRLAQALSALYPSSTDEKRWVDGVLARKKGLGL